MKNIILIMILFLVSLQAEDLEKVSLQLRWKYQFQFAGFIAAKEKGFYKEVGLDADLKEYSNGVIIKNVLNGDVDFGLSDSALIYEAIKNRQVVAMMALFQDSPFRLMGLKSSNIHTLKDINGKSVALYGGIDEIAIKAMLEAHKIKYILKPPAFTLDKLISKDIDLMSAYISNEPYVAKARGLEVTTISPIDYGFDGYGDILFTSQKLLKSNPKLVEDFYKASYRGWEYAYTHIDEVVDIIYNKYNTLHKTKEALKYEALSLKRLSEYGRDNFLKLDPQKVNNIVGQFNLLQHTSYKLKDLDSFIYKPVSLYTKEELKYIKNKKSVKVCGHKDASPFIIFDGKETTGISVEYLKLITEKSHLNFEIVKAKSVKEYFKMVQDGVCDVSSIVVTKPNVHKFLTPTQPIISDSIVLVTKVKEPYIDDLNSLENKKIAILKGAKNLIRYVKSIYPKMNLVEVEDLDLHSIENGNFYGAIGASYQISYLRATQFFNSLKIMSSIGDTKVNGSFGITTREPILLTIFNKSLSGISQIEKQKIANLYLSVNVEKQVDYARLIQVTSVALLMIIIILFFYIKQRKLKIQIENKKDKFENIFNNARDGILILTNGVFTDCNDSIINLLKLKSKQDLLNLTPSYFSPKYQPDGSLSLDKSMEMIELAVKNGYHNFQWIHKKSDKSEFWGDIMLTDISVKDDEQIIHVVWRDISPQKELEAEILEMNNNLEQKVKDATKELEDKNGFANTLLNTTMEAIVIFDNNYELIQANQAANDILQVSYTNKLVKHSIYDFVPPKEHSKILETLSQEVITPYEINLYKKDKTIFPALVKGNNIIIDNNKYRIFTIIDLTEIKEKEQQLHQQSKLAQMGDMISMIAHQWRQPLNAISASSINLSMLSEMEMLEDAKVQENSEFIQKQCQVMSKTIDTFMNFVKPAKESKEFQISHTLEAIMQIMGAQLKNHSIKVNIETTDDNISVVGHEDLLEQVIINLLANARDAFDEIKQEEQFINISIERRETVPVITIEDNAGGVPPEIQDKVFNPYFTTKEQGKGTGIGLYMSLDIMRKSIGGDLVLTAIDGGSRFEIICGKGKIDVKQ